MKTKETIEVFLDNVVRTLLLDEVGVFNNSGRDNVNKKVDNVIDLLKREEAYKLMWIMLKSTPLIDNRVVGLMNKYEKKYLKED